VIDALRLGDRSTGGGVRNAPKATAGRQNVARREVPKADHCGAAKASLLDHLVGNGEHASRAEAGGLMIYGNSLADAYRRAFQIPSRLKAVEEMPSGLGISMACLMS
jgi:hypothetical protein